MTSINIIQNQAIRDLEAKISNYNKPLDSDSLFQGLTSGEYIDNKVASKFIEIKSTTAFPKEITDHLQELNHPENIWGFFKEINRVFIIKQKQIYFWNPFDGSDFKIYDDLKEPCYALKLVQPKTAVFNSDVKHLLLVCQQSQIQLIGVDVSNKGELRLIQTSVAIPTGQIKFSDAISIQKGRIILGGLDGHLYELIYQLQEGLFNNSSRIVNLTGSSWDIFWPKMITTSLDPIRQIVATTQSSDSILFILYKSGRINAYQIGSQANSSPRSVGSIGNIIQETMKLSSSSPYHINPDFHILSMQSASLDSSAQVVVFASNALRLYIRYRPNFGITLYHIRRFSPTHTIEGIPECYYKDGVTILNNTSTSATVSIPCVSAINPSKFIETIASVPLTQPIKAIFNSSPNPLPADVIPKALAKPYQVFRPLKTQPTGGPLSYYTLTTSSLITLSIRRPIDVFVDIILSDSNIEESIQQLQSIYSPVELGLMCLAIMTYHPYVLGGEFAKFKSYNLTHLQIDQKLIQSATKIFLSLKETPVTTSTTFHNGSTVPLGVAIFPTSNIKSIRLDIILEYLCHLIAPIYSLDPFKVQTILDPSSSNTHKSLELRIDYSVLVFVKNNLIKLDNLIQQLEKTMYEFSTNKASDINTSAQTPFNTTISDNTYAKEIKQLLNSSLQSINLLEVLNTLNLGLLTKGVNAESLQKLESLKFNEFILNESSNTAIQDLITQVVIKSLAFEVEGNQLVEILEKKCSLFFSKTKVFLLQAQEKFNQAITNPSLVKDLMDAHKMALNAASQLDLNNLPSVLDFYFQTHLIEQGLELVVQVSKHQISSFMSQPPFSALNSSLDPFFISPEDRSNQISKSYYDIWIQRATHWLQLSHPDLTNIVDLKNNGQIIEIHQSLINFLNRSQDTILHTTIYQWYIDNKWQSLLLEYKSKELIDFLKKSLTDITKQTLLWRILVQQNRPLEAAQSLYQLARRDDIESTLDQRVGYLTSAYNLIQSQPPLSFEHPLRNLHGEISYTLRLATIQMDVLHELSSSPDDKYKRDIDLLQRKIFSDQDLFYTFALPNELTHSLLKLYQLTNVQDKDLLVLLWQKAIQRAALPHNHALRQAEAISREIIHLGTELINTSVFPVDTIFFLLNCFTWQHKDDISPKWSTKVLVQCGVPYETLTDLVNSWILQKPQPFDQPSSIQFLEQLLESILEDFYYDCIRNNRNSELTQSILEQWTQCKQYNLSQTTSI